MINGKHCKTCILNGVININSDKSSQSCNDFCDAEMLSFSKFCISCNPTDDVVCVSCDVTVPMMTCDDGIETVPYTLVCDHYVHCLNDHSDEKGCVYPSCGKDEFICRNKQVCTSLQWHYYNMAISI